jgi:hypothetical protein
MEILIDMNPGMARNPPDAPAAIHPLKQPFTGILLTFK